MTYDLASRSRICAASCSLRYKLPLHFCRWRGSDRRRGCDCGCCVTAPSSRALCDGWPRVTCSALIGWPWGARPPGRDVGGRKKICSNRGNYATIFVTVSIHRHLACKYKRGNAAERVSKSIRLHFSAMQPASKKPFHKKREPEDCSPGSLSPTSRSGKLGKDAAHCASA